MFFVLELSSTFLFSDISTVALCDLQYNNLHPHTETFHAVPVTSLCSTVFHTLSHVNSVVLCCKISPLSPSKVRHNHVTKHSFLFEEEAQLIYTSDQSEMKNANRNSGLRRIILGLNKCCSAQIFKLFCSLPFLRSVIACHGPKGCIQNDFPGEMLFLENRLRIISRNLLSQSNTGLNSLWIILKLGIRIQSWGVGSWNDAINALSGSPGDSRETNGVLYYAGCLHSSHWTNVRYVSGDLINPNNNNRPAYRAVFHLPLLRDACGLLVANAAACSAARCELLGNGSNELPATLKRLWQNCIICLSLKRSLSVIWSI